MDKARDVVYKIKVELCSGRVIEKIGTMRDALEIVDQFKSAVVTIEMVKTVR